MLDREIHNAKSRLRRMTLGRNWPSVRRYFSDPTARNSPSAYSPNSPSRPLCAIESSRLSSGLR